MSESVAEAQARAVRAVMGLRNERDALNAEVVGLRVQRDAVLALHVHLRRWGPEIPDICDLCRASWPCPTARALGVTE